jgi:RND family efflux transporter MFP subunit
MRTLWKYLLGLGALVLLMLQLQGAFSAKTGPGRSLPPASGVPPGETVTLQRLNVPRLQRSPGVIASGALTQLAAKVSGRIDAILVDVGSAVHQGQILIRLDDHAIRAQLAAARAEQAAAQALAGQASADAERARGLFADEALTKERLDDRLARDRAAQARLMAARHAVDTFVAASGDHVLLAPFAGHVVERRVDPGDMATPGRTLLTIQTDTSPEVRWSVPEDCAAFLGEGQSLSVLHGTNEKFSATITHVAPAADPASHTIALKASLQSQAGTLQPGFFVWVEQPCGTDTVDLLPAIAVRAVGQLHMVTVVGQGRTYGRLVQVGKRFGNQLEILSGLDPDEQVLGTAP